MIADMLLSVLSLSLSVSVFLSLSQCCILVKISLSIFKQNWLTDFNIKATLWCGELIAKMLQTGNTEVTLQTSSIATLIRHIHEQCWKSNITVLKVKSRISYKSNYLLLQSFNNWVRCKDTNGKMAKSGMDELWGPHKNHLPPIQPKYDLVPYSHIHPIMIVITKISMKWCRLSLITYPGRYTYVLKVQNNTVLNAQWYAFQSKNSILMYSLTWKS